MLSFTIQIRHFLVTSVDDSVLKPNKQALSYIISSLHTIGSAIRGKRNMIDYLVLVTMQQYDVIDKSNCLIVAKTFQTHFFRETAPFQSTLPSV